MIASAVDPDVNKANGSRIAAHVTSVRVTHRAWAMVAVCSHTIREQREE